MTVKRNFNSDANNPQSTNVNTKLSQLEPKPLDEAKKDKGYCPKEQLNPKDEDGREEG